jgi:hypothetical protein
LTLSDNLLTYRVKLDKGKIRLIANLGINERREPIQESYGIDPEPLFRAMALNPELMQKPGGRYRLDNLDNLWRKASELIDDPCFGLKAADLWHPSNFSALGYAMLASDTLRIALERFDRYHRVVTDERPIKLDETEEGLTLTMVFSHERRDIPERNAAALAVIMSMCRLNYAADLAPVSVTFTHPKPFCCKQSHTIN